MTKEEAKKVLIEMLEFVYDNFEDEFRPSWRNEDSRFFKYIISRAINTLFPEDK